MDEAATAPETLGLRQFAARLNVKPGYVTQLKKAGRLVLTDDGRVQVAESLALIEDTRDPAKAGVAARHAAARNASAPPPVHLGNAAQGAGRGADDDDEVPTGFIPTEPHSKRRAKAMADKEEALARKALRDEQIELGNLLQRDDVLPVVSAAVVGFRATLENLTATLAPQLAATGDEARCKVLMDSAIEHALEELSRKFAEIGRLG